MTDFTHLNALQHRLSNEQGYLAAAKADGEREIRKVWIAQIEREITAEYTFLDIEPCTLSDDELLAELMA